jgi:hypothetical protein
VGDESTQPDCSPHLRSHSKFTSDESLVHYYGTFPNEEFHSKNNTETINPYYFSQKIKKQKITMSLTKNTGTVLGDIHFMHLEFGILP